MTGQRLLWTHSGFTLPRTQLTTLPLSLTFQVLQGRSVTHHIHDSATRRRKTYTRMYPSTGRTDTHTHTQGELKTLRATHNLPRPVRSSQNNGRRTLIHTAGPISHGRPFRLTQGRTHRVLTTKTGVPNTREVRTIPHRLATDRKTRTDISLPGTWTFWR